MTRDGGVYAAPSPPGYLNRRKTVDRRAENRDQRAADQPSALQGPDVLVGESPAALDVRLGGGEAGERLIDDSTVVVGG